MESDILIFIYHYLVQKTALNITKTLFFVIN